MSDYITPKLQSRFDQAGVKWMQKVEAGGMPGFVQGIRPDGKIMVSHRASDCPPEWNVRFWKLADYEPSEVTPL